jgi:hypothetical protein
MYFDNSLSEGQTICCKKVAGFNFNNCVKEHQALTANLPKTALPTPA